MSTMGKGLGLVIVACASALAGCGAGEYKIPAVAPVVKQPPEEDIFADTEEPAEAKPADAKPAEAKPADPKAPAAKSAK